MKEHKLIKRRGCWREKKMERDKAAEKREDGREEGYLRELRGGGLKRCKWCKVEAEMWKWVG